MTLRLLAPAALLLASTACFATRNDVRILQGDIFALRAQEARADSARARQIADLAAALSASVGTVRDSVRAVGDRLTSFQGTTRQELYSIGQQLLQLGELMGQSQTAMRNFRADLEERNRQIMEQARSTVPPAAVASVDSSRPGGAAAVPLTEGPNVLFQLGLDQLRQNSWSAARDAFTQLLTAHPNSDRVPQALKGIADAYDGEGNRQQGDSVYRVVVSRYPTSEVAPTALYKLALSLNRQGRRPEARTTMQQIVRQYPRSDEAALAADWLTRNPG
ncbi:MAG: tetratricopeptide repeat protein [Gemmatimonadaceae bacterium]|nr:tetratricopeptide repeat protein [Gemmatimonadaceae bacterium]